MSDLISRKAAIEAMEQRYCDIERVKKRPVTKGEQAIFLDMRGVVRSLPSWRCRMSDLIRREDAIEVLMETIAPPSVTLDTLVMRIDALPSAEPQPKPISYIECANAMLKMWIDNVLTDGEYYRIMEKLNSKHMADMRGGDDE